MITRAIDNTNDWQFGKGKNDYKTGREACAQNIKTRLQSFLGDCFFALDEGIDWFNLLGSKNITAISVAVRTCVLNTEGVVKLLDIDVKLDSERLLTLKYSVDTIYGNITNEDEFSFVTSDGSFVLLEDSDLLLLEDDGYIELE